MKPDPKYTIFEIGDKIGWWTIISDSLRINKAKKYKCKCVCGTIRTVNDNRLKSGRSKSCGCKSNFLRMEKQVISDNGALKNRIYGNYQRGAKTRKINFDIGREDFLQLVFKNCEYCGALPDNKVKYLDRFLMYNGLDRIDNSKGYVKDNVVPCCKMCNFAKRGLSRDIFIKWCDQLVRFRSKELIK